jgi:hypothetical protein
MEFEAAAWTGEGTFTPVLLEALKAMDGIVVLRVEDAPASRADAGYVFISNEVFVTFGHSAAPVMTLDDLALRLAGTEGIGEPDYADEGMLQYLRTERVVAPYQTKGTKVVEMVRIYRAGTPERR